MVKGESITNEYKTVNVFRYGPRGALFGLTYIGAAIYFIAQTTGGFWEVILGLLQALVWPAYVVYHLLAFLGA